MATQLKQQDMETRRASHMGRASMSPEEAAKAKAFFVWLEATACQLDLDADAQAQRVELYDSVVCLRPYDSMGIITAVQESVSQWTGVHPTDPLNPTLDAYIEARKKEAQLWLDLNITGDGSRDDEK